MIGTIIGSVGVGLLLIAFILNLRKKLTEDHPVYLWMNVIGSGLAAVYAAMTPSIPFVVLESVWGGAALIRYFKGTKKAPAKAGA